MTKLEPIKLEEEFQLLINKNDYSSERALYNLKDSFVNECNFKGKEDGESPLKECSNIVVQKCLFDLRYALWHLKHSKVVESSFSSNARAPFWYDNDIEVLESKIEAYKSFRESKNVLLQNDKVTSDESFWKCKNLTVVDSDVNGFYAFFNCKNVFVNHINFTGKYSFQYIDNLKILDSILETKDAFWHCKNVVVKNSTIKGEYIGWYSKNLKFINCVIESHQPFCYSKNIKLINCKMPHCDLAFENSSVKGNILGKIDSIKNPRLAKLKVDEVGELIKENSLYKVRCKINKSKS